MLVGVSLADVSAEDMIEAARPYLSSVDEAVWQQLCEASKYMTGDFHDPFLYQKLANLLLDIETEYGLSGNRLFYLATMPEHFAAITRYLSEYDIAPHKDQLEKGQGWCRVVYEKPFGYDSESAQKINNAITRVFDESQVFRIDHYLGKALVSNIAVLRFANTVFAPLWSAGYIESVQIILNEQKGIYQRGNYYDRCGALKDMVQSHMLQIMSLVAMEPPQTLTGQCIRDAKAQVLAAARVHDVLLGQYDGYTKEAHVVVVSRTETFAALKVSIDNERWRGVPFYLKTGKQLYEQSVSVHITFKPTREAHEYLKKQQNNVLTIQVEPNEGFVFNLNAKMPGSQYRITPITMNWSHSCVFGHNTPKSYEVLLYDAMRGDQSVFVRFDEIMHSWRIIDAIDLRQYELHIYSPKSWGPAALRAFEEKHGMKWYR